MDIEVLLKNLKSEDLEVVAATLNAISKHPTGDARVQALVREHLNNTGLAVLFIPYHYGEVRYMAGHALSSELKLTGTYQYFVLEKTFIPFSAERLYSLAQTVMTLDECLKLTSLEVLQELLRQKKVPLINKPYF